MNAVYFVVLIGVLVFVHETGHFVFAKLFGVKVLQFSLGFGPKIFGIRRRETEYRVSWIPLGGYVKMLGESSEEGVEPEDRGRAFSLKPLWQRAVIVLAGPAFNLLFPLGLYFALFAGQTELMPAVVGRVYTGLPAAQAGLRPGDRVIAIDGREVLYWETLQRELADRPGEKLRVTVERDGRRLETWLSPQERVTRNALGLVERTGIVGISPRFDLPQIGVSGPDTPAGRAGLRTWDVITAVGDRPVDGWPALQVALRDQEPRFRVSYLRPGPSVSELFELRTLTPQRAEVVNAPSLGIYSADLFVARVESGSPAAQIGLRRGDRLVRLDGRPIHHWEMLLLALDGQREATHTLTWKPYGGDARTASFRLKRVTSVGPFRQKITRYVFGAENALLSRAPEPIPIRHRYRHALARSLATTGEMIGMMGVTVVRLFQGSVPRDTVGGPVMLYYAAGEAARAGWGSFVSIMALISINLGVLNLLPIPVLDGGHLVFFAIEGVRGKPVSRRFRQTATSIGLFLLLLLMLYAFRNDIARYWLG